MKLGKKQVGKTATLETYNFGKVQFWKPVASPGGCTWVHKHPVHAPVHPCITVNNDNCCVCSVYLAHLAVNPCTVHYYIH